MNGDLTFVLQQGIPLTRRPFADLASPLHMTEGEALDVIRKLLASGNARRIGAVFDARRLGYRSALCAMSLTSPALEQAAETASRHEGVTHCYERGWPAGLPMGLAGAPDETPLPNLWFTLATRREVFDEQLDALGKALAPHSVRVLSALRRFKIDVVFDVRERERGETFPDRQTPAESSEEPAVTLGAREQSIVIALQDSIPLVPDPFGAVADQLGMPADSLLRQLAAWQAKGLLRRVALILKHERCGFHATGMCLWDVPNRLVIATGRRVAQSPAVTHCYQRERAPEFSGNLYAMIHTGEWAATQRLFERISMETHLNGGRLLCSLREFKKTSMKYFAS